MTSANSANTVIMVWMQDPASGLGDLLRGTVYLCELSQKLNFRLIVDTQLHPVSQFLLSTAHEYSEYVRQNKHRVLNLVNAANCASTIEQCVMAKTVDPILLITNIADNIRARPSAHATELIRTLLTPTDDFKAQFSAMCAEFAVEPHYSILHLRFGDDDLVYHIANRQKYNALLSLIDAHVDDTTRIISDSAAFKQYLGKVRPHLANRIIPTTPVHLSHSTDKDMHRIKDTLFDLFLLMRARAIKTYTSYTWVSGFVQWVSSAFNVPLFSIDVSSVQSVQSVQSVPSVRRPVSFTLSGKSAQFMQSMQPMQPMQPRQPMPISMIRFR
jgi:hypothetical protein